MATVISVGGSGGGGGGENCIVVHVDDGATVVATHSSGKRYTAVAEGGVATIPVTDVGEFVITADLGGVEATATAEVMDNFVVHLNGIYGIQRDITATTPQWARTDDAVGMMATASVGVTAGQSDFDKVYPWKGMKREVLPTGEVMVKIPKFYFARYREGNIEHIKISGSPAGGLQLHPAFNHAGIEQDCIYVGAYKSVNSVGNDWVGSKSGMAPMVRVTRAQFRTWARNKGAGWSVIDISTLSAIQMLYLVEFAHNNSQQMIGRGYVDGTAKINTGTCDNVPNLTGRPAGTDGKTDIVYRGIEGLWGNVWEFVDGINWNGSIYVCNDPSKYADDTTSNYTLLTYTGATNWGGVYIKEMGVDTGGNQHIMLPTTAASASETTYLCDAVWTTTGWRVPVTGGTWTTASQGGLFTTAFHNASSVTGEHIGSRLIYIP